jgi:peptidoglycan/LPS O-acetylase OafA/YrhL
LIVALRRAWRLPRLIVGVALVSAAVGLALAMVLSPVRIYVSPFPHVPALLIGALLALAVRHRAEWLSSLGRPWVPVAGTLLYFAGVLTVNADEWWLLTGGYIVAALLIAATLGHLVTRPDGAAARGLSIRPLVWLGQRSYGFYLWHVPLIGVVHKFVADLWLVIPVALVATLVITEVSWRLVEQPFLRLKKRFERPTAPLVIQEVVR